MSNKNAPKKKLQLDRTRLRTLETAQMREVVGGLCPPATYTCSCNTRCGD